MTNQELMSKLYDEPTFKRGDIVVRNDFGDSTNFGIPPNSMYTVRQVVDAYLLFYEIDGQWLIKWFRKAEGINEIAKYRIKNDVE